MKSEKIVKEFSSIIGETNVLSDQDGLQKFSIDGQLPKAVLYPDDEAQISEALKFASGNSINVIPVGSCTKKWLGRVPEGLDVLISTERMKRVLNHESRDLVATAECGITLDSLNKKLGENNQYLPVNPMHSENGSTLGGIIASNSSGPLRLGYGTMRELLIGLKAVRSDGTIFKGGSKVVKNVAGYDLPKLFVGSLGTLGIITEATIRLYPVPEHSETYVVTFTELDKCAETVSHLLKSEIVLNSLELLNPALLLEVSERTGIDIKRSRYALAVRIMNVEKAVREQMAMFKKVCNRNHGKGITVDGEQEKNLWDEIINYPWNTDGLKNDHSNVKLKAGVVINKVPGVFTLVDELSDKHGLSAYSSAKAANGIVDITLSGDIPELVAAAQAIRVLCEEGGGSLVTEIAPTEFKELFDVWGDMGGALSIMKRIKQNFDPEGILNPGRFI